MRARPYDFAAPAAAGSNFSATPFMQWRLPVGFGPFLVESDLAGNSLFERENAKIAPGIAKLYAGTRPATMRRYGETDDKTQEVI